MVYFIIVYFIVVYFIICVFHHIQPIADRLAQNLDIISKTFTRNHNSAHGIYDLYHVMNSTNENSHEYPGTPGTKLKVSRNNPEILCHPICNRLNRCISLYICTCMFRFIYVYVSYSQLPHVFGGWCVATTTHAIQMTLHLISVRHFHMYTDIYHFDTRHFLIHTYIHIYIECRLYIYNFNTHIYTYIHWIYITYIQHPYM